MSGTKGRRRQPRPGEEVGREKKTQCPVPRLATSHAPRPPPPTHSPRPPPGALGPPHPRRARPARPGDRHPPRRRRPQRRSARRQRRRRQRCRRRRGRRRPWCVRAHSLSLRVSDAGTAYTHAGGATGHSLSPLRQGGGAEKERMVRRTRGRKARPHSFFSAATLASQPRRPRPAAHPHTEHPQPTHSTPSSISNTMATALAPPTRVRWGDVDDDEEALPPPSCSGPDARGIKTAIEYRRNERGEAVKVTTKTRVSKVERKVYTVSFGGGGAVEGGGGGGRRSTAGGVFFFLLARAGAGAGVRRERTCPPYARPLPPPTLSHTWNAPSQPPPLLYAGRGSPPGLAPLRRRGRRGADRLDHRPSERGHPLRAGPGGQADPGRAQAGGGHEVGAGRVGQVGDW